MAIPKYNANMLPSVGKYPFQPYKEAPQYTPINIGAEKTAADVKLGGVVQDIGESLFKIQEVEDNRKANYLFNQYQREWAANLQDFRQKNPGIKALDPENISVFEQGMRESRAALLEGVKLSPASQMGLERVLDNHDTATLKHVRDFQEHESNQIAIGNINAYIENSVFQIAHNGQDPAKFISGLATMTEKNGTPYLLEKGTARLMEAGTQAQKAARIDRAATFVQEIFGIKGKTGDVDGAIIFLMDPQERKSMGINFDEANHIITGLKNQQTALRMDEHNAEIEATKAVTDEYFALVRNRDFDGARRMLDKAVKIEKRITATQAYTIEEKVRTDLEQIAAANRAKTSFGWQAEAHNDATAITKAEGEIYRRAKPGTAGLAIQTFHAGIKQYGVTGKAAISAYAEQTLADPMYSKNNKTNKLAEVLGKKPSTTTQTTSTPTIGAQLRNPATGQIAEWDGKQWKIIK